MHLNNVYTYVFNEKKGLKSICDPIMSQIIHPSTKT